MNAVAKAGPDIKHRHSGVGSKIESIVAREVGAARGLLVQFVDTPMTACPCGWATLRNEPAENLLRAPGRKVVERSTGTQGPNEAKCCPALEVHEVA